jgi:hypothetical protein
LEEGAEDEGVGLDGTGVRFAIARNVEDGELGSAPVVDAEQVVQKTFHEGDLGADGPVFGVGGRGGGIHGRDPADAGENLVGLRQEQFGGQLGRPGFRAGDLAGLGLDRGLDEGGVVER